MRLEERDVVRGRRKESAALADEKFHLQFDCLPIEQDDWANIPGRLRTLAAVEILDEEPRCLMKGSSVKSDFDLGAVVPFISNTLTRSYELHGAVRLRLLLH